MMCWLHSHVVALISLEYRYFDNSYFDTRSRLTRKVAKTNAVIFVSRAEAFKFSFLALFSATGHINMKKLREQEWAKGKVMKTRQKGKNEKNCR